MPTDVSYLVHVLWVTLQLVFVLIGHYPVMAVAHFTPYASEFEYTPQFHPSRNPNCPSRWSHQHERSHDDDRPRGVWNHRRSPEEGPPVGQEPSVEIRAVLVRCAKTLEETADITFNETPYNISAGRTRDILEFHGFDRDEPAHRSIVRNCRRKLIVTIKFNNVGKTKTQEEFVVVDHVLDPVTMHKARLLNPFVFKVRQEQVSQLYGLKFQSIVNGEAKEEVINKKQSNYTGCDDTSENPTCGQMLYQGNPVPFSQGFCCSCDPDVNIGRQSIAAKLNSTAEGSFVNAKPSCDEKSIRSYENMGPRGIYANLFGIPQTAAESLESNFRQKESKSTENRDERKQKVKKNPFLEEAGPRESKKVESKVRSNPSNKNQRDLEQKQILIKWKNNPEGNKNVSYLQGLTSIMNDAKFLDDNDDSITNERSFVESSFDSGTSSGRDRQLRLEDKSYLEESVLPFLIENIEGNNRVYPYTNTVRRKVSRKRYNFPRKDRGIERKRERGRNVNRDIAKELENFERRDSFEYKPEEKLYGKSLTDSRNINLTGELLKLENDYEAYKGRNEKKIKGKKRKEDLMEDPRSKIQKYFSPKEDIAEEDLEEASRSSFNIGRVENFMDVAEPASWLKSKQLTGIIDSHGHQSNIDRHTVGPTREISLSASGTRSSVNYFSDNVLLLQQSPAKIDSIMANGAKNSILTVEFFDGNESSDKGEVLEIMNDKNSTGSVIRNLIQSSTDVQTPVILKQELISDNDVHFVLNDRGTLLHWGYDNFSNYVESTTELARNLEKDMIDLLTKCILPDKPITKKSRQSLSREKGSSKAQENVRNNVMRFEKIPERISIKDGVKTIKNQEKDQESSSIDTNMKSFDLEETRMIDDPLKIKEDPMFVTLIPIWYQHLIGNTIKSAPRKFNESSTDQRYIDWVNYGSSQPYNNLENQSEIVNDALKKTVAYYEGQTTTLTNDRRSEGPQLIVDLNYNFSNENGEERDSNRKLNLEEQLVHLETLKKYLDPKVSIKNRDVVKRALAKMGGVLESKNSKMLKRVDDLVKSDLQPQIRHFRSINYDDLFFDKESERRKNIDKLIDDKFVEITDVLRESSDDAKIFTKKLDKGKTFNEKKPIINNFDRTNRKDDHLQGRQSINEYLKKGKLSNKEKYPGTREKTIYRKNELNFVNQVKDKTKINENKEGKEKAAINLAIASVTSSSSYKKDNKDLIESKIELQISTDTNFQSSWYFESIEEDTRTDSPKITSSTEDTFTTQLNGIVNVSSLISLQLSLDVPDLCENKTESIQSDQQASMTSETTENKIYIKNCSKIIHLSPSNVDRKLSKEATKRYRPLKKSERTNCIFASASRRFKLKENHFENQYKNERTLSIVKTETKNDWNNVKIWNEPLHVEENSMKFTKPSSKREINNNLIDERNIDTVNEERNNITKGLIFILRDLSKAKLKKEFQQNQKNAISLRNRMNITDLLPHEITTIATSVTRKSKEQRAVVNFETRNLIATLAEPANDRITDVETLHLEEFTETATTVKRISASPKEFRKKPFVSSIPAVSRQEETISTTRRGTTVPEETIATTTTTIFTRQGLKRVFNENIVRLMSTMPVEASLVHSSSSSLGTSIRMSENKGNLVEDNVPVGEKFIEERTTPTILVSNQTVSSSGTTVESTTKFSGKMTKYMDRRFHRHGNYRKNRLYLPLNIVNAEGKTLFRLKNNGVLEENDKSRMHDEEYIAVDKIEEPRVIIDNSLLDLRPDRSRKERNKDEERADLAKYKLTVFDDLSEMDPSVCMNKYRFLPETEKITVNKLKDSSVFVGFHDTDPLADNIGASTVLINKNKDANDSATSWKKNETSECGKAGLLEVNRSTNDASITIDGLISASVAEENWQGLSSDRKYGFSEHEETAEKADLENSKTIDYNKTVKYKYRDEDNLLSKSSNQRKVVTNQSFVYINEVQRENIKAARIQKTQKSVNDEIAPSRSIQSKEPKTDFSESTGTSTENVRSVARQNRYGSLIDIVLPFDSYDHKLNENGTQKTVLKTPSLTTTTSGFDDLSSFDVKQLILLPEAMTRNRSRRNVDEEHAEKFNKEKKERYLQELLVSANRDRTPIVNKWVDSEAKVDDRRLPSDTSSKGGSKRKISCQSEEYTKQALPIHADDETENVFKYKEARNWLSSSKESPARFYAVSMPRDHEGDPDERRINEDTIRDDVKFRKLPFNDVIFKKRCNNYPTVSQMATTAVISKVKEEQIFSGIEIEVDKSKKKYSSGKSEELRHVHHRQKFEGEEGKKRGGGGGVLKTYSMCDSNVNEHEDENLGEKIIKFEKGKNVTPAKLAVEFQIKAAVNFSLTRRDAEENSQERVVKGQGAYQRVEINKNEDQVTPRTMENEVSRITALENSLIDDSERLAKFNLSKRKVRKVVKRSNNGRKKNITDVKTLRRYKIDFNPSIAIKSSTEKERHNLYFGKSINNSESKTQGNLNEDWKKKMELLKLKKHEDTLKEYLNWGHDIVTYEPNILLAYTTKISPIELENGKTYPMKSGLPINSSTSLYTAGLNVMINIANSSGTIKTDSSILNVTHFGTIDNRTSKYKNTTVMDRLSKIVLSNVTKLWQTTIQETTSFIEEFNVISEENMICKNDKVTPEELTITKECTTRPSDLLDKILPPCRNEVGNCQEQIPETTITPDNKEGITEEINGCSQQVSSVYTEKERKIEKQTMDGEFHFTDVARKKVKTNVDKYLNKTLVPWIVEIEYEKKPLINFTLQVSKEESLSDIVNRKEEYERSYASVVKENPSNRIQSFKTVQTVTSRYSTKSQDYKRTSQNIGTTVERSKSYKVFQNKRQMLAPNLKVREKVGRKIAHDVLYHETAPKSNVNDVFAMSLIDKDRKNIEKSTGTIGVSNNRPLKEYRIYEGAIPLQDRKTHGRRDHRPIDTEIQQRIQSRSRGTCHYDRANILVKQIASDKKDPRGRRLLSVQEPELVQDEGTRDKGEVVYVDGNDSYQIEYPDNTYRKNERDTMKRNWDKLTNKIFNVDSLQLQNSNENFVSSEDTLSKTDENITQKLRFPNSDKYVKSMAKKIMYLNSPNNFKLDKAVENRMKNGRENNTKKYRKELSIDKVDGIKNKKRVRREGYVIPEDNVKIFRRKRFRGDLQPFLSKQVSLAKIVENDQLENAPSSNYSEFMIDGQSKLDSKTKELTRALQFLRTKSSLFPGTTHPGHMKRPEEATLHLKSLPNFTEKKIPEKSLISRSDVKLIRIMPIKLERLSSKEVEKDKWSSDPQKRGQKMVRLITSEMPEMEQEIEIPLTITSKIKPAPLPKERRKNKIDIKSPCNKGPLRCRLTGRNHSSTNFSNLRLLKNELGSPWKEARPKCSRPLSLKVISVINVEPNVSNAVGRVPINRSNYQQKKSFQDTRCNNVHLVPLVRVKIERKKFHRFKVGREIAPRDKSVHFFKRKQKCIGRHDKDKSTRSRDLEVMDEDRTTQYAINIEGSDEEKQERKKFQLFVNRDQTGLSPPVISEDENPFSSDRGMKITKLSRVEPVIDTIEWSKENIEETTSWHRTDTDEFLHLTRVPCDRKSVQLENTLAIMEFMRKVEEIMTGRDVSRNQNEENGKVTMKLERVILPNNQTDVSVDENDDLMTTTEHVVMIGEGVDRNGESRDYKRVNDKSSSFVYSNSRDKITDARGTLKQMLTRDDQKKYESSLFYGRKGEQVSSDLRNINNSTMFKRISKSDQTPKNGIKSTESGETTLKHPYAEERFLRGNENLNNSLMTGMNDSSVQDPRNNEDQVSTLMRNDSFSEKNIKIHNNKTNDIVFNEKTNILDYRRNNPENRISANTRHDISSESDSKSGIMGLRKIGRNVSNGLSNGEFCKVAPNQEESNYSSRIRGKLKKELIERPLKQRQEKNESPSNIIPTKFILIEHNENEEPMFDGEQEVISRSRGKSAMKGEQTLLWLVQEKVNDRFRELEDRGSSKIPVEAEDKVVKLEPVVSSMIDADRSQVTNDLLEVANVSNYNSLAKLVARIAEEGKTKRANWYELNDSSDYSAVELLPSDLRYGSKGGRNENSRFARMPKYSKNARINISLTLDLPNKNQRAEIARKKGMSGSNGFKFDEKRGKINAAEEHEVEDEIRENEELPASNDPLEVKQKYIEETSNAKDIPTHRRRKRKWKGSKAEKRNKKDDDITRSKMRWSFKRHLLNVPEDQDILTYGMNNGENVKFARHNVLEESNFGLAHRSRKKSPEDFKEDSKNRNERKEKKKVERLKRRKRQIRAGGIQVRGGQDCMDRRHPPNVNPTKYLESAHCLRFSDLWYSVYELENPIMEHTVYLQLFEKHSLTDGTTHWDDLTQGSMIRLGTFMKHQRDNELTVAFTYSGAKLAPQQEAHSLDPSKERLLVPSPVASKKASKQLEIEEGSGEYLVVQSNAISKDGNDCDKAGIGFATFATQPDRCGRVKGTCLKNQPLAYWRHDMEARKSGRPGCYFLSNFASVPANPIKYNVSGGGSREYLGLEYHSSHVSAIDVEVRADYNAIVRVGSSGRVTEVYIDSTALEHTVVTIVISNMGLASSPYQPRISDCPAGLPVSWTKAKGAMQVISPQHDQTVTLDLYGQLFVSEFHCSVELVNHRRELVAMRRIRVQKMDRCFCVWHCLCACVGSVNGLGCEPVSPEHYHAAGFQGPVPAISKEPSMLMNAVRDVMIFSILLVLLLLLLGVLKWLIGIFIPEVGRWGLDNLLEGSRMDEYFESELKCRCLVTDDNGALIHPDTRRRTVRICSRKIEFFLNLIFFLTYPIAICYNYVRRTFCPAEEDCCPDESKICLINEKSGCPRMICVNTYGDSRNSRLETEDTRYVMNELKKSQESLQGTKRSKRSGQSMGLCLSGSSQKRDPEAERFVLDLLRKRAVFRNVIKPIGALKVSADTLYSLRGYFMNSGSGGYRFIVPCPFKQHWLIENGTKKPMKPPQIYPSNLFMRTFRNAREVYESQELSMDPKGVCINVQFLENR